MWYQKPKYIVDRIQIIQNLTGLFNDQTALTNVRARASI